jgi:hypothetical protein
MVPVFTVRRVLMLDSSSIAHTEPRMQARTSEAMILANRANAALSTGPRSAAGKAVSALNRTTCGLFAATVVVEAAGESAADWEAFRAGVLDDLRPVGVIEDELVVTIAGLLWRKRRVATYEAAALTAGIGELPPDPDAVGPERTWTGIDPQTSEPPTTRLAHLRAVLRSSRARLADHRAAAAVVAALVTGLSDDPEARAVGSDIGRAVLLAAGVVLGWPWQPDPWAAVLAACEMTPTSVWGRTWTAGELRAVLDRAAVTAGREPAALLADVAAQLAAEVANVEEAIADRERAEVALVGEMRVARVRAAAAGLLADDKVIDRVVRAEGHLQRQLERTVAVLEQLQERRRVEGGAGDEPAVLVGFGLRALPPETGEDRPCS